MKTAEEWARQHCGNRSPAYQQIFVDAFKAIQLDALREAAEIARLESEKVTGEDPYAHYAILNRVRELESPKKEAG